MKKRIGLMLLALVTLIGLFAISATADEAPTASIAGHNLSLNDNIYIIYYADFENVPAGAEKGVLVWTSQQESYEYGTQNAILPVYTGNNHGHDAYYFTGVAAKMMAQDVYAKAFVKDGDNITYGALDKYSVLQYCYNKKGSETLLKTGATKTLGELVTSMLNYGATAQEAMNYNTDRLANADFFEIKVVNGSLADTTNSGLFQANDTASLTAPATKNELPFEAWKNSASETVGNTPELQIKVTAADTFTATYVEFSTGLAFERNGDGTCALIGKGTCTDSVLIIPKTSPDGDTVTSVAGGAFTGDTTVTGINLPETITEIGANAFKNSELKDVVFRGSLNDWVEIDIKSGNEKLTGANITYVKPHTHVEVTDAAVAPACTTPGKTKGSHCSVCGEVFVAQEEIPATGHTSENGICTVCHKVTEVIASDGLEFTSNGDGTCVLSDVGDCTDVDVVVPDQSSDGDTVTSIGSKAFKGEAIESINLPNTITEIGANVFQNCTSLTTVKFRGTQEEFDAIEVNQTGNDAFKNATLVLLELDLAPTEPETPEEPEVPACETHTEVIDPAVAPTCTEPGKTEGKHCSVCGTVLVAQTDIAALGHTYGDLIAEVPATCAAAGTKAHYHCSVCEKNFDAEKNELADLTIAALEHTYGDWIAEVPATEGAAGTKGHYHCTACGKDFDAEHNEIADLVIPQTAPAASQGLTFTSNNDGTCSVKRGTCTDKNVVIPAKSPAGDTVTEIAQYAFYSSSIESIVIPSTVTNIGLHAFKASSKLASVTISGNKITIGTSAFESCKLLKAFHYNGTMADWKTSSLVQKGINWNNETGNGSYKVYCTDGTLDQSNKVVTP
ncbi:MAG: leucine-rich repeat protein [Clostridia bacterium]|nr:leucine-rich repeat protein [Clostridia bacterium]